MPMTGRNDPCPCGSGKKYKKCCGQVVPIVPAVRLTPSQERLCGDCTACCDGWLRATIYAHEMKPCTPCHFVREGCCSIYDQRPVEWRGRLAYRLASAGRAPDAAMLEWMMRFKRHTSISFFYEDQCETVGYGPMEFQQDVATASPEGKPYGDPQAFQI